MRRKRCCVSDTAGGTASILRGVGLAPILSSAASTSSLLLILDIVTPVRVYRDTES